MAIERGFFRGIKMCEKDCLESIEQTDADRSLVVGGE